MGIHDRDYYRDSARSMFDSWGRWSVTTWLIIITSCIFIAQLLTTGMKPQLIDYYGVYNFEAVRSGELWRLLSSVFLHGSPLHLVFNMLVLYWAGSRLEDRLGPREFLFLYLSAGLFAGLFRFSLQVLDLAPRNPALGASGAIMALLVIYAFCYPHDRVVLSFFFPMPVWLLVVIYVALDISGVLGGGGGGIGYAAHVGGALYGLLYYQSGVHLSSILPALPARSRPRAAPRLRVVRPEADEQDNEPEAVPAGRDTPPHAGSASEEPFEVRVDRVLDKVTKHGQESLSAEERDLLFRASELYKKRRK
jgi:membrane associated rhomboid family serine protease